MEYNNKTFAANVKAERARLGLTQSDVANAVGINLTTLVKYECGETVPGIDKLWNLASVLKVTPEYLMGWNTEERLPQGAG